MDDLTTGEAPAAHAGAAADPNGGRAGWRLVPRLLLRRSGFGFDVLESLADPDVVRLAGEYRDAVLAVDAARERLLATVLPRAVALAREPSPAGADQATGDGPPARAVLRRLSTLRSAVGRRRPVPAGASDDLPAAVADVLGGALQEYGAGLARQSATEHALAEAVGGERAQRARRVSDQLTPQVLDALLQLAPSCYDGVERWRAAGSPSGSAKDRAMLRRLYRYLQRLAAKNETTSSFGPLVHGVVDPAAGAGAAWAGTAGGDDLPALLRDGVRFGPENTSGVRATEPFLAFWAVAELARRMAMDPRVRSAVPVSWVPANRLDGRRLTLVTGQVVPLSPDQARLAAAVDGRRSAAELVEAAGLGLDETHRLLARLQRLGVVRTWPEPASVVSQPFADLLADARHLAGDTDWPQQLSALWQRVEAFAGATDHQRRRAALAELERDFHALAQAPARRAGGQVYADRMVAYLECEGDLGPVRLDARLAGRIEQELSPVLDLGSRYGELVRSQHQVTARRLLAEAGVRSMPYDAFVRAMQTRAEQTRTDDGPPPAAVALTIALTALVRRRVSGQVCTLTAADLRELTAVDDLVTRHTPARQGARFASPDLLLRVTAGNLVGDANGSANLVGDANGSAPGEPLLVLGEVHPYVFAWGSQRHFCSDPDGLEADFAAQSDCWGGRRTMATLVPRRRHKGLIAHTFPGRFVELSGVASRDRSRTLPLTDLVVEDVGDRVILRDGTGEVVLYAGQDDHPHLLAFAPPATSPFPLVRLGDTAPRIVIGALVAQRAGWWVPAAELLAGRFDADGGFGVVQRLRARRGVPRWVYAHVAGEPKPVCVDLDSPLAVETLLAMLADRPEASVPLREMLPEPSALWLHRQGHEHTSELRLALVRSGS